MKNNIVNTQNQSEYFQKNIMGFVDPSLDDQLTERNNVNHAIARLRERIVGYLQTITNNEREILALNNQIDDAIDRAEDPQQFVIVLRDLETINADCQKWIDRTNERISELEKSEMEVTKNIFSILQKAVKEARPAVLESLNIELAKVQETMRAWEEACNTVNSQAQGIGFAATLKKISFTPAASGQMRCF